MCKKLPTKVLPQNSFKDQDTAMDEYMKWPNDMKLYDAIEQYTTNNKLLVEDNKSFTMRELNKQIKKMLTPQMRLENIKLGGDTLNNKKGVSSYNGVGYLCQKLTERLQIWNKSRRITMKTRMKRAMAEKIKAKDSRKATTKMAS
jgi:hypothetical protein